jgi:hypothetical protein
MDDELISVELGRQKFAVKPNDLVIEVQGKKKKLGDILESEAKHEATLGSLVSKFESYIKLETETQKLIANAHDALAIQMVQANDKISSLEEEVKALKAKEGIE